MNHILVIDDEELIREISRRMLEKNGYKVQTAQHGQEGLSLIERCDFMLVITDLFMPVMDGIEVIQQITASRPELPVVSLCRFKEAPYLKVAKHLGATAGLCKPFSEAELLSVVETSMRVRVE